MLIYQDLALVTLGRDGRPLVRRGAAEAALAGAVLADLLRARRLRLDPVGRRGTLVLSLVPAPATGDAVLDAAVAALAARRLRSSGNAVRSVARGLSGRVRDELHRRGLATVTTRRSFLGLRTWRLADNDPAARSALRLRLAWRLVGAPLAAAPGEIEHDRTLLGLLMTAGALTTLLVGPAAGMRGRALRRAVDREVAASVLALEARAAVSAVLNAQTAAVTGAVVASSVIASS